jgi:predicted transcriptional regulator of viral defense system
MRGIELHKIDKLYFGYEEISRVLGISLESAKLSAHRYTKKGFLVRIKRNIYILRKRWDILDRTEKFQLTNLIQVPSYISLMTAMDYYQITTQLQQDFFESIAVKRTKEIEIEKNVFNYSKIKAELYFGFSKEKDFFIAASEKAFLDAIYLMSLGRYNFDLSSIDFSKFNIDKLLKMVAEFPPKTKMILDSILSDIVK